MPVFNTSPVMGFLASPVTVANGIVCQSPHAGGGFAQFGSGMLGGEGAHIPASKRRGDDLEKNDRKKLKDNNQKAVSQQPSSQSIAQNDSNTIVVGPRPATLPARGVPKYAWPEARLRRWERNGWKIPPWARTSPHHPIESTIGAPANTSWHGLRRREMTVKEMFVFGALCTAQYGFVHRLVCNGWEPMDIAYGIVRSLSLTSASTSLANLSPEHGLGRRQECRHQS